MSNKDCRGVLRGRCNGCDGCDEFLFEKRTFMFAYCSCAPAKHEKVIKEKEQEKFSVEPEPGTSWRSGMSLLEAYSRLLK